MEVLHGKFVNNDVAMIRILTNFEVWSMVDDRYFNDPTCQRRPSKEM